MQGRGRCPELGKCNIENDEQYLELGSRVASRNIWQDRDKSASVCRTGSLRLSNVRSFDQVG